MKLRSLLCIVVLFTTDVLSQELQWFGPRAGIGNLTNSGTSSMKNGIHSAFGWQVELPYTSNEFTGYGEAGLMFLGIEQQVVYPHGWGYFGCRYRSIGGGVGPVINSIGTGLGFNLYTNIYLEKLRIPVGLDCNFIGGSTRILIFIGFNYQ